MRKLFLRRATEDDTPHSTGDYPGTPRWEKVFKFIGIVVVLLYVGSLLFILLFGGGEQGSGGGMQNHSGGIQGQGGGMEDHSGGMQMQGGEQSILLTGPVLLALTVGYLAILAVWAGLRRKFLLRHVVAAAAMWLLAVLYLNAFGGFGYDTHRWNRSFANVSVVLYAVTLAIGPLARLWRLANQALEWRRETGIWATIATAVHVGIFWEGNYGWEGWRSFFYGSDDTLIGGSALNVANVVGLVALVYALVLMFTSNDASQRWLKNGWSWLQKRSTTMWFLVLLHTWIFAYYINIGPPFGNMKTLKIDTLWISFWAVLLLQTAAFTKTVWFRRRKHG
jgi:sulfoxide reductase heme-binding subunit YedZ